jgi:hypothetical protein
MVAFDPPGALVGALAFVGIGLLAFGLERGVSYACRALWTLLRRRK